MTVTPDPSAPDPTPLAAVLARRIAATGPISLADYMAECLLHPEHGYYTIRDPLGAAGDFTTAPEISQMFGECLGLCLAQSWLDQGAPSPFVLAELGPGRGTLMADILRATRVVPGFVAAAEVHLVEASPALRTRQRAALGDRDVVWHDRTDSLPEAPLWLVANEFFDALPIYQFHRAGRGWREVMVALANESGGALVPMLSPAAPVAALSHRLDDTREGDVVEICPAAEAVVSGLATRIARHGGAAIVIDYGNWNGIGDSFQALHRHRPVDPFARPGEADLTAHVDFAALAQAARAAGAAVSGMTAQGALLERLGIGLRAERLAAALGEDGRTELLAAHRRLTAPSEMGTLFKSTAIHPVDRPPPPGFDPPF